MAECRKRAREADATEALVQLSKHQRIAIREENEYESESLSGGDASLRADDNPANSAGLVSQLQQEVATVQRKNGELEVENKELREKVIELSLRVIGLEAEQLTVAGSHSQLAAQNHHLSLSLSQSVSALRASRFGENLIIAGDNSKTRFYTGLPTYELFVSLFNLLKPFHNGATNIDNFFATLVYLRLHTPMVDLGTRLQKDSKSTVSRMFHSWIDTMYHNLRPLVSWPDAETLKKNLPNAFKKHFSNVKCIIDCFEIFTERPAAFYARASTYSNYKKHNTLKVLIGIAPTGAITFISKAWTGRVSDKVITQKCGLLDHLEYGDVVLADRGFNVHDELALVGARLEIPSFTKGKTQLSRAEVEKSR